MQDYVLEVKPAIAKLRATSDLQGIRDIFAALDRYL